MRLPPSGSLGGDRELAQLVGPLVLGMGQGWGWECGSAGNSLGSPWISFGSILRVSVGSSQRYQLEGVLIQAPQLHQLWGYQLEHPEGISLREHQPEHPNGVGLRGSVWASQLYQLRVESVQASQIHQPEGSQSEHPACTSCGGYQGSDGGRGYQSRHPTCFILEGRVPPLRPTLQGWVWLWGRARVSSLLPPPLAGSAPRATSA